MDSTWDLDLDGRGSSSDSFGWPRVSHLASRSLDLFVCGMKGYEIKLGFFLPLKLFFEARCEHIKLVYKLWSVSNVNRSSNHRTCIKKEPLSLQMGKLRPEVGW